MVPCACVYKRGVPRLAPLWWWNLKKKNLGGNNDAANLFTSQFNNQTYKRCTCKMYIYMYPTCCHTCKYHCVTLLWRMNWWVILSQDEYTTCVFVEMTCKCYLPSLPLSHILLQYHIDHGLLLCACSWPLTTIMRHAITRHVIHVYCVLLLVSTFIMCQLKSKYTCNNQYRILPAGTCIKQRVVCLPKHTTTAIWTFSCLFRCKPFLFIC